MTTATVTPHRPALISTRGFHLGHIVLPDWCREPPRLVQWGTGAFLRDASGDYIETFVLWLNPRDVRA